jgi:hypothetical protein
MYFFWISVPQIISGYNAQLDYKFVSILPVSKKEIVSSKIIAFILIELTHIVSAVVFGVIHNLIYGSSNLFLEINLSYFGIMLIMLALFNIIFLPNYFKTAYKFGKPLIIAVIVAFIFAGLFEVGAATIPFMKDILKTPIIWIQTTILLIGIALFIGINFITLKKSVMNFESIK